MGEVRIQVRVQACSQSGNLNPRGPRDVLAFVDTGASKTIVSESLAAELGIRRMKNPSGVSGIGGTLSVPVGLALVVARSRECDPTPLLVGISDKITREAGADVLLGHDYMQAARMVVRPHEQSAVCEKPRTNPARRRSPARAKRSRAAPAARSRR